MKRAFLVVASILLPSVVWSQTPVGGEFQVNSYTTGSQVYASVAGDAAGNFVVVWGSYQPSYGDIFGQRYDRDGNPLGGEFQVNSYTTFYQFQPNVAMAPDGSFVVAWSNYILFYGATGVFGQRFASDGTALGGEFQVNSYTLPYYCCPGPRVAADGSGDFVVVWNSYFDGSYGGISGQRFSSTAPVGSEFVVNTYTTFGQYYPSVSTDADGDFVVTWFGPGDGSIIGIVGQRFGSDGAPQGGEFQVNSYTTGFQYFPSVAMDDGGSFAVVWQSYKQDGSSGGVFGQRFGSDGAPQGGEFQVNSYTTYGQYSASVSTDADGDFVVTWWGPGDGSSYGIFAQQFSSDGTPEGAEFEVNTYTSGFQAFPVVAAGADGDFVVVWNDYNAHDGSGSGIFGQRFNGPGFTGNAPTIGLTINQTSFSTGSTMNVGANINNPGSATTDEAFIAELLTAADFYFGALLPDGDTIVFVTDFATLSTGAGTLSDLSTLSPITVGAGFDLAGAFLFSDPNLLSFTFTGAEASGAYTLFLVAVLPGGFADGVADPGDIIALGTADFTFTP